MPTPTYVALAKTVLTGSQTDVTFSSIPSTYTDLVVLGTARRDGGTYYPNVYVELNATASSYSGTIAFGNNTTPTSANYSAGTSLSYQYMAGASNTSNTFSSFELYFPNYAGSTNKPISATTAVENNSSTNSQYMVAHAAQLWSNTAAINSIRLYSGSGNNFVSGSSFYLYGIKNS